MVATHVLPLQADDGSRTWTAVLFDGRASALFAVLAGVTLALASGGARPVTGRDRAGVAAGLAVRAALIAALGLALGLLDSGVAVILTYYGVLFCLGLPFLALRAPALLATAAAWAVAAPVLSHVVRPDLPPRGYDNPTFGQLRDDPGGLLAELTFTGYYPVVPWLAYLLLGMAIGRLDLRRIGTAARVAIAGFAMTVLAPVASTWLTGRPGIRADLRQAVDAATTPGLIPGDLRRSLEQGLYGATPTDTWAWLAVANPHTATPLDLVRTGGSALLVIGLALLATRLAPRVWQVVFGAGAMTLTLYSLHVVLLGRGVWTGESLDPGEDYLRQIGLLLALGAVAGAARRRGPLEAVVAVAGRSTRRLVTPGRERAPLSPR